MKTVVITGASGMIGQVLMKRLEGTYHLRGIDVRPCDGVATASVADYDALLPHFEQADAVVHLGAAVAPGEPWERVLEHNIIGTRNVYEAAKAQRVPRVIFASSHQSMILYEHEEPYASVLSGATPDTMPKLSIDAPFRPSGFYGASKAFGEILGRVYSDHHGLSVLCIRIVQVNGENHPHGPRWFSHGDVEGLVRACIEADGVRFGVYWGISDNDQAIWDLSNAERDLGYRPQDGIREE